MLESISAGCYAGKVCPPALVGVGLGGTADLCMRLAKEAVVLRPGAAAGGSDAPGYRAITIAGIRDPAAIAALDVLEQGVREAVVGNVRGVIGPHEYRLRMIRYGLDGVLGPHEAAAVRPHEVGLVIDVVAPTQELADHVLSLARSTALHQAFPGRKTTAGNLAFPFSPSDFSGGPVYEFSVYHLLEVDDPDELFGITYAEVG